MIGIYKITNLNNRIYIGQSLNINQRFEHYYKMKCKSQPRLYASFLKYGVENHKFEIIEECSIQNLNERERFWQEHYKVLSKKGMNCHYVKTDDFKLKVSEETCQKISKSLKGRKLSLSHVKKIKKALSNRIVSDKVKEKIGSLNRGKKICRKQVEKTRQTILSLNKISPNRKKIIQTDLENNFIEEFESITHCAKKLKIHRPNIIKVLNKKRHTTGGFKFYYSAQNKLDEFRETPEVDNPEPSL